jgi:hypothetical protein
MKTTASTFKILVVLTGLLTLAACNPIEKSSKSDSMLIVESITATNSSGATTSYLQSAVETPTSDTATATLMASLLDPDATSSSQYNSITLTGYQITYTLPDGTGQAGVTVPAPLEGTCSSLLITIANTVSLNFIAVTSAAKLVAPLAALVGTTNQLQVVAHITFTGHDGTNHPVQATGQLAIIFGVF